MQQNPTLRIQIEGHTCNIGTAEYNLALGDRRANSVRDYLTSRGIGADRLGDRQLRRGAAEARQRARRNAAPQSPRRAGRDVCSSSRNPSRDGSGVARPGPSGSHPLPEASECDSSTSISSATSSSSSARCGAVVRWSASARVAGVGAHRSGHRRRPRDHACRSPRASRTSPASRIARPAATVSRRPFLGRRSPACLSSPCHAARSRASRSSLAVVLRHGRL